MGFGEEDADVPQWACGPGECFWGAENAESDGLYCGPGLLGNQLYMLAAVLSHNLNRELQMEGKAPDRGTTEKRAPLWVFEELRSLRHRLIQRAGRFTNPQGNLTLTLSANTSVKEGLLDYLEALQAAA